MRYYTNFLTFTDLDLITKFDILPYGVRSMEHICNGCDMPTDDAYSSGHLVLSHLWTCICSNVETNLSWTCLVSELFSFEHPSVLLFYFEIESGVVCHDPFSPLGPNSGVAAPYWLRISTIFRPKADRPHSSYFASEKGIKCFLKYIKLFKARELNWKSQRCR